MKIAFLFPGQGTQKVGMGKDLYREYPEVREIFKKASQITKIDISMLCFQGVKKEYEKEYEETAEIGEDLNQTKNTQIAIATLSLAILKLLEKENIQADIVAGLSLGEYPALIYSGFFTLEEGIHLLERRGYYMQSRVPKGNYSMAAVMGLEGEILEAICKETREKNQKLVIPANYNYTDQIVISGEKEGVLEVIEKSKEKGAKKVIELKTGGPFHTPILEEASREYGKELSKIEIKKGNIPVIKNLDGSIYKETDNIKEILKNHIISPVRFDKTIQLMLQKEIQNFVEIGPGKTLTGFVKKEALIQEKEIDTFSISDVETLKNAIIGLKM